MAMAGTFEGQMYNLNKLLSSLVQLGSWMRQEAQADKEVFQAAYAQNAWFTPESIGLALTSNGIALDENEVLEWSREYRFPEQASGTKVGLILPGNLPLVGWHDIMCTVLSGHQAHVKMSKDDAILPRWVVNKWAEFDPYVASAVTFHEGLMSDMHAVLATGGANASRYFQSYFGHLPHIFRGPRTSVAVLNGEESNEALAALGKDVFAHFGMGCRSVTKIWIPEGFDLDRCFAQWLDWGHLAQHAKYANNYDYHKAVWLLNKEELIENGFLLVKQDDALVSPIGTLFVERFKHVEDVANALSDRADEIQVVSVQRDSDFVGHFEGRGLRTAALGSNQFPGLGDYADGVDTMTFLLGLHRESISA